MSKVAANNPRLAYRLRRALLITLIAVLVIATIAAAVTAYLEASDIQDETLLSVARLVETNQMRATVDDEVFDDDDFDDSAVRVWQLGRENRHSIDIKKPLKAGFHTLHENDDFWRIYVTRASRKGDQFIVAQKASVSAELALNSAKNTALPLLLLFLVVPLLVTLIVRHSFKPLNTLAAKVDRSTSLQLDFPDKQAIPVELMPFVSAIDTLLEKNESYNQRQKRFIADAAHELRTPITALSLQIENVQGAPDEKARLIRQSALEKSVSRLQRLVNQLLDLARAQTGLAPNVEPVSMNETVKNQIGELYLLAEAKSINLGVSRNEAVMILDNNHQAQHLVRNALSNAIKFTPNNGEIDIKIYRESDQAVFIVADNGPGVAANQLQNIHLPFYHPDGQVSGTGAGLGLAICHEIAAQLGGTITLQNLDPSGFQFCYKQAIA